jgi:hypothetical protein
MSRLFADELAEKRREMRASYDQGQPLLRPHILWLGWAALLVVQIFSFSGVRSDDAFITYRYGQNLATGVGLVFNPGDRMLGSTSPGQMLLTAGVYAIAGLQATPSVMATLGCLAWSAQVAALFMLLQASLGRGGAALVAGLAGIGATGAQTWVPLETNLVAACVLFAFVAADRGKWYAVAILAAAATLLRPDAWLAAIVLGAFCIWERRQHAIGPCAAFLALAAAWPIFAWQYYGSPLPQSALTKYHRATFLEYFFHELTYPSAVFLPDFITPPIRVCLMLVLATSGGVLLLRRAPRLAPFVIYGFLHALAYLQLRPFTIHQWHLYPWVVVLCVLSWASLIVIAGKLAARARRAPYWVAVAACGYLIAVQFARFAVSARELEARYWTGQRQATYVEISKYLVQHAAAGDWFGSVEVGTIAYYSNLSAFDFGGLVTRPYARLEQHPVRFLVVDKLYMQRDNPVRPVFQSQHGEFLAVVYRR